MGLPRQRHASDAGLVEPPGVSHHPVNGCVVSAMALGIQRVASFARLGADQGPRLPWCTCRGSGLESRMKRAFGAGGHLGRARRVRRARTNEPRQRCVRSARSRWSAIVAELLRAGIDKKSPAELTIHMRGTLKYRIRDISQF